MAKIASIRLREISRPLRCVFTTALGSKALLQGFLVAIRLHDGTTGVGEIPTSFSCPDETPARIKEVVGEAGRELKHAELDRYEARVMELRERFPRERMTVSGLEVALFRASLKERRVAEHVFFGAKSARLETDITIPFARDGEFLTNWIRYAVGKGFSTFKVKVSGDAGEDRRLLSLVHGILVRRNVSFRLRIDCNQGFTVDDFLRFFDWIHSNDFPIELFEQPLPRHDLKGLSRVRRAVRFPIILDESVESRQDLEQALEAEACDGINIKIAKSGIAESLDMMKLALDNNLSLMVGCMTETMVGLSAAIHLAAGTGSFRYIDLDSIYLLHHRNRYDDIVLEGPIISIG